MNITLKYLKYFIVAAKYASFAKASEHLYVSSSSVIAAINKLEEEFGFALFVRQPARGLILTPSGRKALKHAKFILQEVEEFSNKISGIPSSLTGALSLGCFATFSPYFMPQIIAKLHDLYPELKINVFETDLKNVQKLLINGEIDAFLSYDVPRPTPQIFYETLRSVPPYALLSPNHPLADKPQINLKDLASYPMTLFNMPSSRSEIMSYFESEDFHPEIVLRSQSIEGVREYVGEGFGFSLLHIVHPSGMTHNKKRLVCRVVSGDNLRNANIIVGCLKDINYQRPKKVDAFIIECQKFFSSRDIDHFFINSAASLPTANNFERN